MVWSIPIANHMIAAAAATAAQAQPRDERPNGKPNSPAGSKLARIIPDVEQPVVWLLLDAVLLRLAPQTKGLSMNH